MQYPELQETALKLSFTQKNVFQLSFWELSLDGSETIWLLSLRTKEFSLQR